MRSPVKLLGRFLKEEGGATAIEYGVIAFSIFFAILVLMQMVGDQLGVAFNELTDGVTAVQP